MLEVYTDDSYDSRPYGPGQSDFEFDKWRQEQLEQEEGMNAVTREDGAALLERVIIGGDLMKLSPTDRMTYYAQVCQSVGLNPLTKPFEYITLNGKLTLYARRDATDQLRSMKQVSVVIKSREVVEDCYVVTASASMPNNRTDESIGAVSIASLKGDARANAMMKAETKAKRRVTLSICGLGMLDETEIETVPTAQKVVVNTETGEIEDNRQTPRAGAFAGLNPDMQTYVLDYSNEVRALLARNDDAGAYAHLQDFKHSDDADVKAALWDQFDSKERSRLVKAKPKVAA